MSGEWRNLSPESLISIFWKQQLLLSTFGDLLPSLFSVILCEAGSSRQRGTSDLTETNGMHAPELLNLGRLHTGMEGKQLYLGYPKPKPSAAVLRVTQKVC